MTPPTCIAVVEDDADERVALGRVLRASGFDVKSYPSAEDFLASEPAQPLCLLLDIQLEGMSGLDLLRVLRTDGSTLPVIVVTASDDADFRGEAERLGCVAYLRKPFQGRTLVALLRTLAAPEESTPRPQT
jgi:FixJ family two-component response regulator